MLRSTILSALCYALCVYCTAHLSVQLKAGKKDQQLSAIVTNDGDEALKILHHPLTIFTAFPTDTFKFTAKAKEGVPPRFKGIQIKYSPQAAIAAGAFTFLAPGQSVQVQHDLTKAYDFSESGKGIYQIEANNIFYIVDHNGSVQTLHAETFGTEIHMSIGTSNPPRGVLQKRATSVGCSASRQSIIVSAATQAQAYATESLKSVTDSMPKTTNKSSHSVVFSVTLIRIRLPPLVIRHGLEHIQQRVMLPLFPTSIPLSSGGITNYTYDCTCTDPDVLAYIYPDNYKTVYLCISSDYPLQALKLTESVDAFWTAPRLGFDGQAGILLKLSSEFTINGGASAYVYGQSACKALALSNPAQAISNADSIEYFAINDPPLP